MKDRGRRMGRPPATKEDIPAVFFKHDPAFADGKMKVSELARLGEVSKPTVYESLN